MKSNRRKSTIAFSISVLLGLSAGISTPAQAGTADSTIGLFTVYGVNYTNQATIYTTPGSANASTLITTASGTVPAGWMGARARLFNSSGVLIQEGQTSYTPVKAAGYGVSTIRSATGTWYSYGVTYSWNGNGYSAYYTFRSPNQSS